MTLRRSHQVFYVEDLHKIDFSDVGDPDALRITRCERIAA